MLGKIMINSNTQNAKKNLLLKVKMYDYYFL